MTIVLCLALLVTQTGEDYLPKYMTAEESLMVDMIGTGHRVTPPPAGWVETPAEFDRLRGVLITWIWGSYNYVFREIVREAVDVSKVYIVVGSSGEQSNVNDYLQSGGVPRDSVEFMIYPRNSVWNRDYGPWFINEEGNTQGMVDFIYNRPRPLDDTLSWYLGADWSIPVYGSPLTHAGGNFMVDGKGTGFASTLIYEENQWHSHDEIDSLMLAYSGLDQFIVLPRIHVEYTGHIDLWTKMLNDTLVMVGEYAPGHVNYARLNENADSIARCTSREGQPFRVVRIPMPWSSSSAPPSYLNSLFVNGKILVPLWGEAEDDTALFIYEQVLPDHEVVGIDCSSMSGSGGAIHCITMQVPSERFLHVKHEPLGETQDTLNPRRVVAKVITSSGMVAESTEVYYRTNGGIFETTGLTEVVDTPGVYEGYIPAQSGHDTVEYYCVGKNEEGIRRSTPSHAPSYVYTYVVRGEEIQFIRGDVNGDMHVDVSDYVYLWEYLRGGESPSCMDAGDLDDDGRVTEGDVVSLSLYFGGSGGSPESPYPDCGSDESGDSIDCLYHVCEGGGVVVAGGDMSGPMVEARRESEGEMVVRGSSEEASEGYQVCMSYDPSVVVIESLSLGGCVEEEPAEFIVDSSVTEGWYTAVVVFDSAYGAFNDEGLVRMWYRVVGSSGDTAVLNLADSTEVMGGSSLSCVYSGSEGSYSVVPTIEDGEFVVYGEEYVRGDANGDMVVEMADVVFTLKYLYVPGSPEPPCMDGGDTDDDGAVVMSDGIYTLQYLYIPGAPDPLPPFPDCGEDPTPDTLGCDDHPCIGAAVAP